MSRIHDALRRAEKLGVPDPASSINILADLDRESISLEDPGLDNDRGISRAGDKATADAVLQPPSGSDNLNDCSTAVDSMTSKFTELTWTAPDSKTLFFLQPESNYSMEREQLRTLRSRLYQIRGSQPLKTILISSALPQEGKTFIAANLALAMGKQRGRRILLIDADLRNPVLGKLLGAPDSPGLVEYLSGEAELISVIQKAPISNLFFLPGGKAATNPGELIGNGRFPKLIENAGLMFDWIIIDSPPAVPVTDASLIADGCDGVILVVKASSTGFDVARKACSEFRRKPLLGVVLNRAETLANYLNYYYSRDNTYPPEESKG